MNILNYTRKVESWQPGCTASTRDELLDTALKRLCTDAFYEVNPELSHEAILEALIRREEQRTTAVGESIAFPHARLEHLSQALFAVVTLPEPVLFDGIPVRIAVLMLIPLSDPSISLKLMSQLSRILLDGAVHGAVLAADSPEALRTIFKTHNPRIDKPLLACDIMRPPRWSVRENQPVSQCTHVMGVNGLQALPVISDQREVLGEITVERLFCYGLPDFFTQLKSVSFIAEFDPFEKYFKDEGSMSAAGLMEPCKSIVPLDYTIMEIVFDLAIRSRSKLYVVDDRNRWVGTIDKGTVLDNVINY